MNWHPAQLVEVALGHLTADLCSSTPGSSMCILETLNPARYLRIWGPSLLAVVRTCSVFTIFCSPTRTGLLSQGEFLAENGHLAPGLLPEDPEPQLPVRNELVRPVEGEQVLKMAMPRSKGLRRRFSDRPGRSSGCPANSVASAPYHALVIGSNDEDMALSYNVMVHDTDGRRADGGAAGADLCGTPPSLRRGHLHGLRSVRGRRYR